MVNGERAGNDIVLTTINARYSHSAFGLRCLRANLGPLRERSAIVEFDLKVDVARAAEQLLKNDPRILGISVYIWNSPQVEVLLDELRCAEKKPVIVLGGPEVSWLPDEHPLVAKSDYVICGEGETAFAALCRSILVEGEGPADRRIAGEPEDVAAIALPYDEYTDEDIASRIIYAETSRGCPFRCAYCLSARDKGVRFFPLDELLPAFEVLLERGASRLKFLDRSFNINDAHALRVLQFFRKRLKPGMQLHFELIPDRLSGVLKEEIALFPTGALHFEVGMQTYDAEVARRIDRVCDFDVADENMRWLSRDSGADVHADLIAGLPEEDLDSFGQGFNRLYACGPHEIQVGILKRLFGAPIDDLTEEWSMVYRSQPPYDVLSTSVMSRETLDRIKRFARFWEVIYNRGDYPRFVQVLLGEAEDPFQTFMALSDWLFGRFSRTHAIPMLEMLRAMQEFLTEHAGADPQRVAQALVDDYLDEGRRIKPPRFLTEILAKNGRNSPKNGEKR